MSCKVVDDLGRVQIPKAMREMLGIKAGDTVEVFVNRNGDIVVRFAKEVDDDD